MVMPAKPIISMVDPLASYDVKWAEEFTVTGKVCTYGSGGRHSANPGLQRCGWSVVLIEPDKPLDEWAACWSSLTARRRCAKTVGVCWRIPPSVGMLLVRRAGGEGRPAVQPNAPIVCFIVLLGGTRGKSA